MAKNNQLSDKPVKRVRMTIKNTEQYLKVLNGMLRLTDKELTVLAAFIDKRAQLQDIGLSPFSTDVKKKIADELGMEDFNTVNVYIKRLKDKRAIHESGDSYDFNPLVIPIKEEGGIFFEWQRKTNS